MLIVHQPFCFYFNNEAARYFYKFNIFNILCALNASVFNKKINATFSDKQNHIFLKHVSSLKNKNVRGAIMLYYV